MEDIFILEGRRTNAFSRQDPIDYYVLCEELGVEAEDQTLHDQGEFLIENSPTEEIIEVPKKLEGINFSGLISKIKSHFKSVEKVRLEGNFTSQMNSDKGSGVYVITTYSFLGFCSSQRFNYEITIEARTDSRIDSLERLSDKLGDKYCVTSFGSDLTITLQDNPFL